MQIDLPRQVCNRILLAEKCYAEKLKRESKAKVVAIRRRRHRNSLVGLILEAWGSLQSLQQIHDLISDEAKTMPWLFGSGPGRHALEKAYVTIFKNCHSDSSPITFVVYSGPCQPAHDRFVRAVPLVRDPDPESLFSRDKFIEYSLQQFVRINANYDETVHGKIRAVISYGTYYVANCDLRELPESEFDRLFDSCCMAQATNPDLTHSRGRAKGRGRKPGGRAFGSQPVDSCRSSFIPTGNLQIESSQLLDFLQDNGFALAEENVEYRLTMKLNISGGRLHLKAVVALDENFNLKSLVMPDFICLCVNVVSANKDHSNYRPNDCRFKIQSRVKQTVLQMKRESEDFAEIIAKHRTMLLRTGKEVYGVHPDFLEQISFVRKKHTKVYRVAANQHGATATTDAFLCGMAIRINCGTEYTRPSPKGEFQNIDHNRVEVTVEPELPDLLDEDKMRTFFSECWQFAEELGSVLE